MATESEELRLSVTLDDQATAGLQKLREALQQVGSMPAITGLQRAGRTADEYGDRLKQLTAGAEKATLAQLALARGIRNVAGSMTSLVGATLGLRAIENFSQKMVQLEGTAKAFGTTVGVMRSFTDQANRFGVETDRAAEMLTNFLDVQAEVMRAGSRARVAERITRWADVRCAPIGGCRRVTPKRTLRKDLLSARR
jgi:hypothetical protein